MKVFLQLSVCLFLFFGTAKAQSPTTSASSPEQLAQEQLDAYNARDIDAFLKPYSDEVEIYNFPDQLISKGKESMRKSYAQMFANTPKLHCELVSRMVQGNTVIDQERVTGFGPDRVMHAIAVYKVEDGKIAKVYFIQ
ncbi:MAG: nuclear transport factor 2 family protein [Bacteroidota bacterium]